MYVSLAGAAAKRKKRGVERPIGIDETIWIRTGNRPLLPNRRIWRGSHDKIVDGPRDGEIRSIGRGLLAFSVSPTEFRAQARDFARRIYIHETTIVIPRFEPSRRRVHDARLASFLQPVAAKAVEKHMAATKTARNDSTWIDDWDPENANFWESRGKRIARRNLIWSIVAENLGFSIWLLWSVTATKLAKVGFHYSTEQLFNLVALPGLVGSLMRFPYAFAVPKFGGRNWTIVSALLLFVPTVALAFFVSHPETPYWLMALAAATAGLGGGNFASSMANISFFFPDREKGFALGLNAAGGNVGVSTVQLLIPLLVGWGWIGLGLVPARGGLYLANAGLVWLPFIAVAVFGAARWMNNLTSARANFRAQMAATRRKDTWAMAWLYIGTFGSFIGYSAAFPLLLKTQFPEHAANVAFVGPLVGSLARPFGGRLADRFGGTRMTFWNFVAMGAAALAAVHFVDAHAFGPFLATFLALFVMTGIGNGSTFRMIPVIFRNAKLRELSGSTREAREAAIQAARIESATVLGLVSAIGACGGYIVPRAFGASIGATGSAHAALASFVAFYVTCIGLTWALYMRRRALAPSTAIDVDVMEAVEVNV